MEAAIPHHGIQGDDMINIYGCRDDIGHTLVHYLYTGEYETLQIPLSSIPDAFTYRTEYRRSLQTYSVARMYDIHGLRSHATRYARLYAAKLSIFEILKAIRELFPLLQDDESQWLQRYTKARLREAFDEDETTFKNSQFLQLTGGSRTFDQALMSMVIELYSTRLGDMRVANKCSEGEECAKNSEDGSNTLAANGESDEDVKEKASESKAETPGEIVKNPGQVNGVSG